MLGCPRSGVARDNRDHGDLQQPVQGRVALRKLTWRVIARPTSASTEENTGRFIATRFSHYDYWKTGTSCANCRSACLRELHHGWLCWKIPSILATSFHRFGASTWLRHLAPSATISVRFQADDMVKRFSQAGDRFDLAVTREGEVGAG